MPTGRSKSRSDVNNSEKEVKESDVVDTDNDCDTIYDCVIVGAGVCGLTATCTLKRLLEERTRHSASIDSNDDSTFKILVLEGM